MLTAIHALIHRLGLFDEPLEGATVADSQALYAAPTTYYRREALLPDVESSAALRERFFGGVRKPVFTSANAHNHLMTFAEVIAMYLLAWSPTPWKLIEPGTPELDEADAALFRHEQATIERFVDGLPAVARLLAHLPTLMIFDDHDITDDWNLTADWEQCAYGRSPPAASRTPFPTPCSTGSTAPTAGSMRRARRSTGSPSAGAWSSPRATRTVPRPASGCGTAAASGWSTSTLTGAPRRFASSTRVVSRSTSHRRSARLTAPPQRLDRHHHQPGHSREPSVPAAQGESPRPRPVASHSKGASISRPRRPDAPARR